MSRVILGLGATISSTDVAVIDSNSEALGVPRLVLMENAGRSVAEVVAERLRPGAHVLVYAGPGGNGGDGLVAARHLAFRGYRVTVVLASRPESLRGMETRSMYEALEAMDYSVEVEVVRDPCRFVPPEADAVIDALLGVGLRGAPRSPYRELIEAINASSTSLRVAVDVPSGLNADTGETPGAHVKADVTVTFHKPKPGLLRRPDVVGELIVAPIGVPPEAEMYYGPGDVEHRVPRRGWETRKGKAGRVLVIGGSEHYIGAPILAAMAAEAGGVDLVFLASNRATIEAAMSKRPTLVPVKLEDPYLAPHHIDRLRPYIMRVDAIAIGMGLGVKPETGRALALVLDEARRHQKPVVVDADGLKLLHMVGLDRLQGVLAVLTPHDGEFEKLFGKKPSPVTCMPERIQDAAEAATAAYGSVVLLKGPVDVIASPTRARLNKTGAPSMSAGGTGDILAGLVAAMLAKKLDPFDAAGIAAYVNGAAGSLAYSEKGDAATALDVLEKIPLVLHEPASFAKEAVLYRRLPLRSTCRA